MKLKDLKQLMDGGMFHHATYRNRGTLWEGLWIYQRETSSCRGFGPVGAFLKDDGNIEAAMEMVKKTGISVGSYGQG